MYIDTQDLLIYSMYSITFIEYTLHYVVIGSVLGTGDAVLNKTDK